MTKGSDEADVFKFKAKGGVAYEIKARPAGEKALLKIESIWDADGANIKDSVQAPNEGTVVKVDKVSIPKDGYIFFKVVGVYQDEIIYSLAIGENSVETPPKPKDLIAK